MSLLGHLWVLSALVVPLVQDVPKMIITVYTIDTNHIGDLHFKRHKDTYRKPWGTSFASLSINTYLTLESIIFCISIYRTSLKRN